MVWKCKHCDSGKLLGKHHDTYLGDFHITDTGSHLPNNRNTLYKATCIYCGYEKYGQYSDLEKRCLCYCENKKKCKCNN